MGPSHPSTHGVLRLNLELDGEIVKRSATLFLGYLHRGDEKIAENMTYNQFVPYTDRLDYLAPLANNAAYVDSGREISESRSRNAARPYVFSRVNSLEYRLICSVWEPTLDVGPLLCS